MTHRYQDFRTRLILVLICSFATGRGATECHADPPLLGDPFAISAEPSFEGNPAAAHNPIRRRFLVVWVGHGAAAAATTQGTSGDGEILVRAVGDDGEPLGEPIFLGNGKDPDVAFNSAADLFLVVWSAREGEEIQGRLVSGDGTAAEPTFLVSAGRPDGEMRPAVAFNNNSQHHDFLVVWEDGSGDFPGGMTRWAIWGQRVKGAGADPQLTGTPIEIAETGPGGPVHAAPDVAYNLNRNEFLVVYSRTDAAPFLATPDIFGRRITGDGEPLPEQLIDNSTDGQGLPAVAAFHPNQATPYLVVFLDFSTSAGGDVRGRLLNGDGQPLDLLDIATRSDRPEDEPAIIGGEGLGGYQVAWSEGLDDPIVAGRRVSDTGVMGPPFFVSRPEGGEGPPGDGAAPVSVAQSSPAVAGDSPLTLAVWQDRGTYTNIADIAGRRLAFSFEGRVFAGLVGDDRSPIADVLVSLFCSDIGDLGFPVGESVTDPDGTYRLIAPVDCPFYNIIESDPPGLGSEGATTPGGAVLDPNWIQYSPPLDEKPLTDNNFWDDSAITPEPTPTVTGPPVATDTPDPMATPTPSTTGIPSATSTPSPTGSIDLTVNSTDDNTDGSCDATHCSLREAISAANQRSGSDTIRFAIPTSDRGCDSAGVCTIQPQSFALPELIGGGTTIDGFTQTGASANTTAFGETIDAELKIVVNGSLLPSCCPTGIDIRSSGNTVRGLVIQAFHAGIEVLGGNNNNIDGNFIGTSADGSTGVGNRCSGIVLSALGAGSGSSNNNLGGASPAARNLISDSGCAGVAIGPGQSNRVYGNYIGTDATGASALPNTGDGLRVFNASEQHRIGGTNAGEQNLIAFNGQNGIEVDGGAATAARISIRRNSIASNAGKGILLLAGANNNIAAPAITSAQPNRVSGTACASCTIEIFSDAAAQGAIYEGSATANASGNWSFDSGTGLTGPNVTATATDSNGNTSEFSMAASISMPTPTATAPTPTFTATVTGTVPTVAPTATPTASPPTPTTSPTGALPTATATVGSCTGDCDGDGAVSIAELIRGVNIALDKAAVATCPSFDSNGDGDVRINELIEAVNDALRGCGSAGG